MPTLESGPDRKDQIAFYLLARTMIAQARGRTVLPLNEQQQKTHKSLHFREPDIFPRVDELLAESNPPVCPLTVDQMAKAMDLSTQAVVGEAYFMAEYIRQLEGDSEIIASLSSNERRRFRRRDLVGSYYFPQVVRSRVRKAMILEFLAQNQPTAQPKAA